MKARTVPTTSSTSTKKAKKNEGSTKKPGKNVALCWICARPVAVPCDYCRTFSSIVNCPVKPCRGCGRNYYLHCHEREEMLKRKKGVFDTGRCTDCKLVFGL